MKLLVTGAAGFLGSYILRYFRDRGHYVAGVIRNSKTCGMDGYKFISHDLSEGLLIDEHYDAVIHTAAATPRKDIGFSDFKKDNIDAMESVIKFSRRNKVNAVINISTKNVYSMWRENRDVTEDDIAIGQDAYAVTKYVSECMLRDCEDINSLTIRLPGIVAPLANNIWITNMVDKILRNEDVCVNTFVNKNFIWVYDLLKFMDHILSASMLGNKFSYNVVNLACQYGCSNEDILNHIKMKTNSVSKITKTDSEKNLFNLNIDRAINMGFNTLTPIEIVDLYLDSLKLSKYR